MKRLILILVIVFAFAGAATSQPKVLPSAIYIVDQQTGAQVPGSSDAAIAFKNSFIALVRSTATAKIQEAIHLAPGKREFIIQQLNPAQSGNAYQLTMQRKFLGQANVVYMFLYNVDQNKLYFFNPDTQNWDEQIIAGANIPNLNVCQALGVFNIPQTQPVAVQAQDAGGGGQTDGTLSSDTVEPENVSAQIAPPALPDYEQPECPEEGDLWQPGYWGYSVANANYYWVPGAWVAPPNTGLLWTPPYWGVDNGVYVFHTGYWGEHVGFYGGVAYGYGYEGMGFVGGEWHEGHFRYNTAVLRVGANVHNRFVDARIIDHTRVRSRLSFDGAGGINARPSAREMAIAREHHVGPTADQIRNRRNAASDRSQYANGSGRPGRTATQTVAFGGPPEQKKGEFNKPGGPGNERFGGGTGVKQETGGVTSRPNIPGNGPGQGSKPGVPNTNPGVKPGVPNPGSGVKPGVPNTGAGVRPGVPNTGAGVRPGVPNTSLGPKPGTPNTNPKPVMPGKGSDSKSKQVHDEPKPRRRN